MKYRLACGDAVPGCSARFEEDDRDTVLQKVVAHARADHGVMDVTPDMLEAMTANIVYA
jgi:predicted small metal-binding protein